MSKRVIITAGRYAGQTLQLGDDVAAKAVADKWAYDPAEHPPGEEPPTPDEGETPDSLTEFEADPEGKGQAQGGEAEAEKASDNKASRSKPSGRRRGASEDDDAD